MNRRLVVDLEALAANYQHFCQAAADPAAEVGAVVKADAYGIGATAAARRLQEAGCRSFFVASAAEGSELRRSLSPGSSIFVLEGPQSDTVDQIVDDDLIPVLNDPGGLECWRVHRDRPAALHVDTGMTRLGFPADVAAADVAGFKVVLLLTHLACADDPANPVNERQMDLFRVVRDRFPGIRTSVGNSAGWLNGRQGNLGRPGIGLFGANPFSGQASPVQAVASLEGRILQLKTIAAGDTVGYGATWTASSPTDIAVVGIGYADGVPRSLSGRGEMAIAGCRCPILGRVSMDMTVIDVTDVATVAVGDWAECFGSTISVDEVAGWADTIAYEVLTGVGPRVVRQYQAPGA
jgi:alanine racemase